MNRFVCTIFFSVLLNDVVNVIGYGIVKKQARNIDDELKFSPSSDSDGTNESNDDQTCNITTIISKSSGEIKSLNYPDPYPTNCQWTYVVHVGNGHKILVKLVDWDLDTDEGDELSIQPISSKDKSTHMNGYTYTLSASENSTTSITTTNTPFELNTPCCDSAIIKFTVRNHSNENHTGFLLIYQRNENSATDKPSPGIAPGWHQIYLCGMSLNDFYLHEDDFRNSLIDTVETYSKSKKIIPENGKVSLQEILINAVIPCPTSWPSSANCLQLNYSVTLDDGAPGELTSEHLEEMWEMYCATEELTLLGLWEYEIPNIQWLFWFWIGLLCFLSLFFCLLLIIILKTKLIYYYFLRLKLTNSHEMTRPTSSVTRQQQNMMMPLFTAENPHRFQFVRSYEKLNNIKPSTSCQNITAVNAEEGKSKTEQNDLESEEDLHIYQTLSSMISKVDEECKDVDDSNGSTLEVQMNDESINPQK